MARQSELVDTQAIEKRQDTTPERMQEPLSILQVIARASSDPSIDVEKMERLVSLYERMEADRKRVSFMAALAEIQAEMPQIAKTGKIVVKGQLRSEYAKLEDIDRVIRPMLKDRGFSLAFNSESADGKLFTLSCTLSHREGHSETKTMVLPIDKSDYRSDVQSIGSTISYARRQLVKMHLNIIEMGEDTDGANLEPISEDQARDLLSLIDEVKADKQKVLRFAKVDALEKIPKRVFDEIVAMLERKRLEMKPLRRGRDET